MRVHYTPITLSGIIPALIGVAWIRYRMRKHCTISGLSQGIFIMMSGMALALLHHQHHTTPPLVKAHRYVSLTGEIVNISTAQSGKHKVLLDNARVEGIEVPLRLRLSVRTQNVVFRTGDTLSMKATIFPPSRPAFPGGFDFNAYFGMRGIDGVGYSTGSIAITHTAQNIPRWRHIFAHVRQRISEQLMQYMRAPSSGVAIALVTADKSAIDTDTRAAMTASGLAHMLAISGMHMAILCGMVFFTLRYALASIPMIALKLPIKQYAAWAGLFSGAIYLALADFPISAIRAYTMIGLVLGAIICHREADTIRSLALAATLLLLISPFHVMDAGFQLSFAAVTALILMYRRIANHTRKETYRPFWQRSIRYVGSIAGSSLIASIATASLTLYHFNAFAPYSVLANMLALPLLSLIVMPALLLGMLTLPLGLEMWPLWMADTALQAIIAIAHFVANLPYASWHTAHLSGIAVCVVMLCLLWLVTSHSWRQAGIAVCLIAAALSTAALHQLPDILISEDRTAIALKATPSDWVMFKGGASNFHMKQWQDYTNQSFHTLAQAQQRDIATDWICGKDGCDGTLHGQHIRMRFDYKAAGYLCRKDTDILISTFYSDRWYCIAPNAYRLDRSVLEKQGSTALWLRDDSAPQTWFACQHPWQRCALNK